MEWPWTVGDDGLTKRERRRYARQYARTIGRRPTKADAARLQQAVEDGLVPIVHMRRGADGHWERVPEQG